MSYIVAAISNGGDAPEQAYRKLKSAAAPNGKSYGGVLLIILCCSYIKENLIFLLYLFGQFFAQKYPFCQNVFSTIWCLNSPWIVKYILAYWYKFLCLFGSTSKIFDDRIWDQGLKFDHELFFLRWNISHLYFSRLSYFSLQKLLSLRFHLLWLVP